MSATDQHTTDLINDNTNNNAAAQYSQPQPPQQQAAPQNYYYQYNTNNIKSSYAENEYKPSPSTWLAVCLYILSAIIPLVGWIIGCTYSHKPTGQMCAIISAISFITIYLITFFVQTFA